MIKGKRRECQTADGYLIREIRRGSFERSVAIPREFDLAGGASRLPPWHAASYCSEKKRMNS